MSIYLGNNSPIAIYKGSQPISAVYAGENKVWPDATSGITAVDYIESDGNCWFDIGPLLTKTTIVVGSFYQANTTDINVFWGSNGYGAFLATSTSDKRIISAETLYNGGGTSYDISRSDDYGSLSFYLIKQIFGAKTGYTGYAEQTSFPYLYDALAEYLSANPTKRFATIGRGTGRTFDSTQDVFVMKGWKTARLGSGARCFGFRMWDNDTATFDGVPATDGTNYGLYDKVSGTFFTNVGTGTLTGGNL